MSHQNNDFSLILICYRTSNFAPHIVFTFLHFSLCFLGHSQELRNMLHNKHLREMMKEIDSSEDPGKLLVQAMQIPIFTEFVDECLRIVEPQDENEMELWVLQLEEKRTSLCLDKKITTWSSDSSDIMRKHY